jgi:hypothetical protein
MLEHPASNPLKEQEEAYANKLTLHRNLREGSLILLDECNGFLPS